MFCSRRNIVGTIVKAKFLQIRISEEIKNDLQITAELKGLSTSALIHSLIVKSIREEKDREPKAFLKTEPKGMKVAPQPKTRFPLVNSKAVNRRQDETSRKKKSKVA